MDGGQSAESHPFGRFDFPVRRSCWHIRWIIPAAFRQIRRGLLAILLARQSLLNGKGSLLRGCLQQLCLLQRDGQQAAQLSNPPEEYDSKMAIHKTICCADYADFSSVQLESAIAPKVIGDALARGVILSAIVSDGDNKTHDVLAKSGIYNDIRDAPTINRFECIAHVAKRMKTNLHKRMNKVLKTSLADKAAMSRGLSKKGLKKVDPLFKGMIQRSSKGRESWDTKPAEEIWHLSLAFRKQIASYYRLAVQRNAGDVPSILAAIKAIPLQLSATDENAQLIHPFCPYTSDSWCRYQQAMFNSERTPSHPNYLGPEATSLIQDLFQEFGYDSEEFVTKIAQGLSSNHNEATHSLLFTMVRKMDAAGMDVMELSSALAVIRYNDGYTIKSALKSPLVWGMHLNLWIARGLV